MVKKFLIFLYIFIISINTGFCSNYLDCNSAIDAGQPFILYIHANYCNACRAFSPIFESVVQNMSYNIVDINFSYPQTKNICTTAESRTIPAVYIVNPNTRTRSKIKSDTYFNPILLKKAIYELINQ